MSTLSTENQVDKVSNAIKATIRMMPYSAQSPVISSESCKITVFQSYGFIKTDSIDFETFMANAPMRSTNLNWGKELPIETFSWDDTTTSLNENSLNETYLNKNSDLELKIRSASVSKKKLIRQTARGLESSRRIKHQVDFDLINSALTNKRQNDCNLFMIRKIVQNVIIEEPDKESSSELAGDFEIESLVVPTSKDSVEEQNFSECLSSLRQNQKYLSSAMQMTSLLMKDKTEVPPSTNDQQSNLFSWSQYNRMSENMAQLPKNFSDFRSSLRNKNHMYNEEEVEKSLKVIKEELKDGFNQNKNKSPC